MKNSQNQELIDTYLREANVFGEWKSTNGFADPLLNLPGPFAWLDEIEKDHSKLDTFLIERRQQPGISWSSTDTREIHEGRRNCRK